MSTHEDVTPSLVLRLQRGDAQAGETLEQMYREKLVRFCHSYLQQRADAEDAASEVILKVLAAREVPDEFRPWLLRIARNHCLNRLRDAVPRAHESLTSDVDRIASATGPLTNAARADDRLVLERTLALLSPTERELLRLRYVDDLSREEVAVILDLPVSVVKSRLYEAIAKLRAKAPDA
jgi:RNA polymerase sigma-70 factor (ECF subfamily)